MTGTVAWAASCSSVRCENTRAATTSTHRERLRPTSGTDSRLPIPISWAARYTAAPPSCTIATSKVTRVRSEGFSKIRAMVRRGSGVRRIAGLLPGLEIGREGEQAREILPGDVADGQEVVHFTKPLRT